MEGKFYVIYMNHPDKKHDEWSEEEKEDISLPKGQVSVYKGL